MEYEYPKFRKYVIKKEETEEDFPFPESGEIDLGSLPISFFDNDSEEQIILKNRGCIRGKRF